MKPNETNQDPIMDWMPTFETMSDRNLPSNRYLYGLE